MTVQEYPTEGSQRSDVETLDDMETAADELRSRLAALEDELQSADPDLRVVDDNYCACRDVWQAIQEGHDELIGLGGGA